MNQKDQYSISMKNLQMYNYLLEIKGERHVYQAIIEAVLDDDESMMIWLGDFDFPLEELEGIKEEIELFFKAKNIKCIFRMEKRISH